MVAYRVDLSSILPIWVPLRCTLRAEAAGSNGPIRADVIINTKVVGDVAME